MTDVMTFTPEQVEQRIEAAAAELMGAGWAEGRLTRALATRVLAAADRTVDTVPMTWPGLLAILDAHYPAAVFTPNDDPGPSSDPGVRIIGLARALTAERERIERLEAAGRHVDAAYRDFRSSIPFQPREAMWDLFREKLWGPLGELSAALGATITKGET